MQNTSIKLLNQLTLQPSGGFEGCDSPAAGGESLPFLNRYATAAVEDLRSWHRSAWLIPVLLAITFCVQTVVYFGYDSLPLEAALRAALLSVLMPFGFSWFLVQAIWVDLFHQRSNHLGVVAATICLCWCAATLWFPVLRF